MRKKLLSIFIVITMMITYFAPFVLGVNIVENDTENLENDIIEENEKTEFTENMQEEIVQNNEQIIEEEQEKQEEQSEQERIETIDEQDEIEVETTTILNEEIEEDFSIYTVVNENRINPYIKDGNNYLFLPKSANLSDIVINYTGNIKSVSNAEFDEATKQITCQLKNESQFVITLKDGQTKNVVIMQSDVPAIFVNLNDGATIQTVNSGSKDIKYSGSLNVTGCDNSKNNISQDGIEFKGRGNTSWTMAKKSYQIKLNKKANFLGIGNSKEKKWVLIANYQDPTLLKNKIMNDLCVNSGLSTSPNCTFADLYVNGDYIGNYLVCDKIEIGSERVSLKDDEGLLMELDNAYYYQEDYYFTSKKGNHYTVKEAVADGNDEVIRDAMNSFKNALDAFEDELYSSNPSWEKIAEMIDIESFAKYYLVNEFAENTDSYYSSCYLYRDGDNDVIHMGPTWDYDAAFGYSKGIENGENPYTDYTLKYAFKNEMQRLYIFPEFSNLVNEIYMKNVKSALDKIEVNKMALTFEKSSKINAIVWSDLGTYSNLKSKLNSFVEQRKAYYNTRYSNSQIEYSTHVENVGWLTSQRTGISGTEGQSLRLEGLKVEIGSGYGEDISVSYRTHIQNIGWQNWVSDGELSGTAGQSLRLEAVQLKLNNSSKYSIRYRVHIQNIGWSDWSYDGEIAGTEGMSLRLEAIEIQIVEKRDNLGTSIKKEDSLINYIGHIQNIGDTGYGADGETIGTIGKGLRLEGLKVELGESLPSDISLEINEHIENIGWVYGLTDKQYIGTQGQFLRLEALSFKLKGDSSENYTIKYRVHIQDIGWQNWVSDGQIAGTVGQSLRIEAIQIMIEKK